MDVQGIYELVGYAASILIAISLMMRSILRLRIINLVGAVLFTIYGLVIGAAPVAAVNFFITLVNIYYLYQIYTTREDFTLLEVQPDSDYLRHFLEFHAKEIDKYQPGFAFDAGRGSLILFILRDMIPAGLIIAEPSGPGTARVLLDFVIPGYRDFKVARYLFEKKPNVFKERGIDCVCSPPGTGPHAKYLRRMGFSPANEANGEELYCLNLN